MSVTPEERDFLRLVGKSWGWVLFFGIVTLILGVLVVWRPKDTIYAFAILLGIWLFVAGLFRIVMAIADHEDSGGTRWMHGRPRPAVGDHRHPVPTSYRGDGHHPGLPHRAVLGGGRDHRVLHRLQRLRVRRPAASRIAMGVLAFAAGVVTLVWPHVTLGVLAVLMGIWLILYGVLEIALSLQLRHLADV